MEKRTVAVVLWWRFRGSSDDKGKGKLFDRLRLAQFFSLYVCIVFEYNILYKWVFGILYGYDLF
ncbi:hypothetical protein Scep_019215 [Stephania cephalantha]|uniref:Uncharacterized protein n=1 Tax=Stephania cephalantha TaxID=152367 RepID=A0AAP0IAA5_9MAGN